MSLPRLIPAIIGLCLLPVPPWTHVPAVAHAAAPAPQQEPAATTELDGFMEKVLARREVNRKTLEDYILDEAEGFEILGPGRTPLHRSRREFTWYVRDGMHVRSPVRFNGVPVGERDRERYETDWIRRERDRRARKEKREKEGSTAGGNDDRDVTISASGIHVSGTVVPTEPRFVSEAYFLEFKFEPGNYYLAGREQLDGQEVLKIEYYPTRMFGDSSNEKAAGDRPTRKSRHEEEFERDIESKMNKTALVTLWIDPAEHQIVKYVFENVWLDFLPGAWLVRVDDMRAAMTMGQPFAGVWLPKAMEIRGGITLAAGSFDAAYERNFSDYRLAEVETRIGPPRDTRRPPRRMAPLEDSPGAAASPDAARRDRRTSRPCASPARLECQDDMVDTTAAIQDGQRTRPGPFVPEAEQVTADVIREIRVHGNAFLTDAEVLAIAGVKIGDPLTDADLEAIRTRLRESRRFESVDVRKRYRSLTDASDVALLLVVHERPGVRSTEGRQGPGALPGELPNPARRVLGRLMFLPILGYGDGYGFTYGGRFSTVDLFGARERLSVPLTWGGTRKVAVEAERTFDTGPVTRIDGSGGLWSRENPRFAMRDTRAEVKGRAERVFADVLRAGVQASRSTIAFGDYDDRLWAFGTSLVADTRRDPAFPANAVYGAVGWTGLHFSTSPAMAARVDLFTAEARGYLRLYRQLVLAARALYTGADATLPPYERLLVGGAGSLRGFRAGSFDGDRTTLASAELRAPITSILSGAKFGVTAFVDAAAAWDHGEQLADAPWHRGAGGGIFLITSVVRINLDVARGLRTGRTRVHLSSGFSF